jgi:spore coat protein A, manganese oxidase
MDTNIKLSRRQLLKSAAIAGVGMTLPLKYFIKDAHAFYQSPGLQRWQTTLRGVGPGQIPVVAADGLVAPVTGVAHYKLKLEQFFDQLHPALGPTKLWGFNPVNPLGGGNQPPKHLGGIFVVNKGTPAQITFKNTLPAKNPIPIDTSLPGANQGQNRIAVHLHGGLIPWISDGGPFDWWAPNGTHGLSFVNNVLNPGAAADEAEYYYGNNQSARMLWYHDHAFGITRINAYAGVASAYIIRDSFEAAMIGPAGLPEYIEASVLGGRAPTELPIIIQDKIFVDANIKTTDPTWVAQGMPSTPGSLWYPHVYEKNRWKLVGAGTRLPNPSVIPEMFGDTMLANGTVYPQVDVEPRRYRLRILNACNARFLNFQLYVENTDAGGNTIGDGITVVNGAATNPAGPAFLVLGTEGGFLPNPVSLPSNVAFDPITFGGSLITGPAERWDVLVDFSAFAGKNIILYNDAPAPFPFGDDRYDYYFGNPLNPFASTVAGSGRDTRQIMRFRVGTAVTGTADQPLTITQATDLTAGNDPLLADPLNPDLIKGTPYTLAPGVTVNKVRHLTLNEAFDVYGRLVQVIGTNVPKTAGKFGRAYLDSPTEVIKNGDVEIWEVANLTGDSHPIHIHLVNAQILYRRPFDPATYNGTPTFTGGPLLPDVTELGWKETLKMHPNQVIYLIMKFELPLITNAAGNPVDFTAVGGGIGTPPPSPRMAAQGIANANEYVYHCHILEHEEHDMMRPMIVIP